MKRIGVVGCGARIRSVIRGLLALNDQIRVTALYDPSELSIESARDEFKAPECKVCGSMEELAALPEIDWVFIGSWNRFHAEAVLAAFRAGKNVFCEKPLALSVADGVAIMEAWRRSGKAFSIGFTLRYAPLYRRIREILDAGTIGRIVSLEFNETLGFNHGGYIHGNWRRKRENAGTHLLEKCCHDLDLVNWFVGSRAMRVAGFGGCDFFTPANARHQERIGPSPEGEIAYQAWPDPWGVNPFAADKDVYDNQVAVIEFENRVRAGFHTNVNTAIPERRMYICGTEGTIRADVVEARIEVSRIGWETRSEVIRCGGAEGHGGGDEVLHKSLERTILQDEPPFTGVEDGLRAMVTALAIDEACDTGKVVDLRPYWQKAGLDR